MRKRVRTLPTIEVDGRASIVSEMPLRPSVTGSIAVSCDDSSGHTLTTPEREHIFADLQSHNDILNQHEIRLDEIDKLLREHSNSMPVTVKGPKGISIIGSWRIVAFIAVLITIVAVTYITLPYYKPMQTQKEGAK